jgi:hypothetical protein
VSAGDDIRELLAASASTPEDCVALRMALERVAERLDKADEMDRHDHEMRDGLLATINAQTDHLRALEAKVAALDHRTIGSQMLGGQR